LFSKLTYRIAEAPFRREVVESVKRVYGLDIGAGWIYRVFAYLRIKNGWTSPFRMIYDTGAMVSLLPSRFYDILGVEKYASIKLMGISPESEVTARLTRATLRLEDIEGNRSPDMEAWVAIAERDDVPLILGLKDVADTHELIVKPRERIFHLQFY